MNALIIVLQQERQQQQQQNKVLNMAVHRRKPLLKLQRVEDISKSLGLQKISRTRYLVPKPVSGSQMHGMNPFDDIEDDWRDRAPVDPEWTPEVEGYKKREISRMRRGVNLITGAILSDDETDFGESPQKLHKNRKNNKRKRISSDSEEEDVKVKRNVKRKVISSDNEDESQASLPSKPKKKRTCAVISESEEDEPQFGIPDPIFPPSPTEHAPPSNAAASMAIGQELDPVVILERLSDERIWELLTKKGPKKGMGPKTKKLKQNNKIRKKKRLPSRRRQLAVLPPEARLDFFTDEQLWSAFGKRSKVFICQCPMAFMDRTAYVMHQSLHDSENPLKCAVCLDVFPDWTLFMSHFISRHPTSNSNRTSTQTK